MQRKNDDKSSLGVMLQTSQPTAISFRYHGNSNNLDYQRKKSAPRGSAAATKKKWGGEVKLSDDKKFYAHHQEMDFEMDSLVRDLTDVKERGSRRQTVLHLVSFLIVKLLIERGAAHETCTVCEAT